MAKAEGKLIQFDDESKIAPIATLETFESRTKDQLIETVTHEFSAVCPFSGLPDVATVIIRYIPINGLTIELKSLKYYMISFRSVGIYQEHVTKRIYEDLRQVVGDEIVVRTIYKTRGGFDTTCTEGVIDLLEVS